jgi:hypothetical protein
VGFSFLVMMDRKSGAKKNERRTKRRGGVCSVQGAAPARSPHARRPFLDLTHCDGLIGPGEVI